MPSTRSELLRHLAPTSPSPVGLTIERAQGIYMYGPDGRRYMDLIAGISVSNVGHCHPRVVQAVQQQAATHMHLMVYGEYVQNIQLQFAERIVSDLPAGLTSVYFVNSGSEAVEGAIKLAKRVTGRSGLVAFKDAYHGSSNGALSLMGNEAYKGPFYPLLPDVRHIRLNEMDDLRLIDRSVAAVFLETIQGEAGVRIPAIAFMKALRQRCSQVGALLVLDEIQCGFGRTGSMFAFEQFDIVPDVMVIAKGMGGGMPIGAFVASHQLMETLSHDPILGHITTFGGHPVSCAAGLAALHVLEEEQLVQQVPRKEALFREHLKHPAIREVRGRGLLLAIQLDSFAQLTAAIDRCISCGIVTDWFLFCNDAMRIAPPLTISDDEIIEACQIIVSAIDSATK
ncbi:MAG: aminotransferase class III-fold pyridoxal phosphate-dependent enzyme [Flavobacteriales bacterium]|nr:aminotransferase class III-fold pyridoxal phosphate-dependent enzyme [Flavobacteriales bacterium]